ncbi:polysaccharide biosynthesis tyrosine autokinase [Flavobacterium ovatum]|uniref:GumC family protein n=1 Tax=Flavobacterium ovatum TaxID=1928857 RepID=UPI00344E3ABE
MENEFGFDNQIATKNLVFKYLKYWKLFAVTTFIALVSMTIYLRYTKNIYSIESKIKILDDSKTSLMPKDAADLWSGSKVNLDNEIEVITSRKILEPVVSDLNLTTKYYHEGKFVNTELWNIPIIIKPLENKDFPPIEFQIEITKQGYTIKTDGKTIEVKGQYATTKINNQKIQIKPNPNYDNINSELAYRVAIIPTKSAVNMLSDKLNVTTNGKSDSEILIVGIEDENFEKSVAVVNKIIEIFNEDGINDRQLVSKRTIDFIHDRFKYLSLELDSIENKKKQFKQSNNLSFIQADVTLDMEKKAASESELFKVETQLALSNLLKDAIDDKNMTNILPANLGLENEIINTLIAEFNVLVIERDKLFKTAGSQNPTLIGLDSKIGMVKNNIKQSISTYSKQLKISLSQQEKEFNNANRLITKIPSDEQFLRGIERQQKIKEELYLLLLQKREESAIAFAITSPSLKVIDFANGSKNPISPKKSNFYLIALMLGLLLPFCGLYLYFTFDTKIKSKDEVEFQISNIPVVAEIPYFEDKPIFKNKDERSIHSEIFRILSSNINFSLPLNENKLGKVILVTSSIKGEGKTYISSNLSLALASYNKKVLIIGADMRKPKLKEAFYMEDNNKGLSTYLHEIDTNWKDLLVTKNPYNNDLHLLFTGIIPPNSSNLLSNGRLETLLNEAKKEYDYIIIDSAPTIYVNDTFLISNLVDLTVYTTRYNYTEKQLIRYSTDLMVKNKLKNVVYVLNGMQGKANFNYGYGYGYGEDIEPVKKHWSKRWFS